MSTTKLETTSNRGPFDRIIEKLKKFIDDMIKESQSYTVKKAPVKETKPKVKQAPKKVAVKKKI